jgi:hypothetical protein
MGLQTGFLSVCEIVFQCVPSLQSATAQIGP